MRLLHRFRYAGGQTAEICEQTLTQLPAIEILVFVNGSLLVSEVFHQGRELDYAESVVSRVTQFLEQGWRLSTIDTPAN